MIKVVCFDLDDTLYPEISYVKSGFVAASRVASKMLGLPQKEFYQRLLELFAVNKEKVFDRALGLYKANSSEALKILVEAYRNHKPTIQLFPETLPVLIELQHKYKLALITDGTPERQQNKVEALGIANFFKLIICTGTLGKGFSKPSERPFQMMLETFDCTPVEAVYVADNPAKDFLGPNKLGMHTIRITKPESLYVRQSGTGLWAASYNITSLYELPFLLEFISG